MVISQLINDKGNGVLNQFILHDELYIGFQSYNSLICKYYHGQGILELYPDWNYSRTTLKHLKYFINEYTRFNYDSKKQFDKLIESNDKIVLKKY